MGHKVVCLNCYRVENLGTDLTNLKIGDCPICSNKMIFVNHKFRPPKKTEKRKEKMGSGEVFNFRRISVSSYLSRREI